MKGAWIILLVIFVSSSCTKRKNETTDACIDFISKNKDTVFLSIGEGFSHIEQMIYVLNTSDWNYDHVVWSTGDTLNSVVVSKPGEYEVLAYNSSNQLVDSSVIVINEYVNNIQVPNTFTPDGDGINDNWYPILTNICIDSYTLHIYDQHNTLIIESINTNYSWDGTYKTTYASSGHYTYQIEAIGLDGKQIQKKGIINLLH